MKLFPFSLFTISGNSMAPTLKPGQNVITFNWARSINLEDIIVANVDKRLIIKRVKKIDRQKLFLVGDNKQESTDSREYGAIHKKNLIGKVVIIL